MMSPYGEHPTQVDVIDPARTSVSPDSLRANDFHSGDSGVVAPDPDDMLEWSTARAATADVVHLVGCHGGAGVDTLDHLLGTTVSGTGMRWPTDPDGDEPVYVALVARDSLYGLERAQIALRQWRTGGAPSETFLLGLILIAASPNRKDSDEVKVKRQLITGLAPTVWQVRWHEELVGHPRDHAAQWEPPQDESIRKRRARSLASGPTPDVADLAQALHRVLHPQPTATTTAATGETTATDTRTGLQHNLAATPGASTRTEIASPADAFASPADSPAPPPPRAQTPIQSIPPTAPINWSAAAAEATVDIDTAAAPTAEPSTDRDLAWVTSPAQRPESRPRTSTARRRATIGAVITAAILVATTVLVGIAVAIGRASDSEPSSVDAILTDTSSSPSAASDALSAACPATTSGAVTTGNDAGDQSAPTGVIKAFQYAYYTLRDAKAAEAVTARSAGLKAADMQPYIDKRPPGTTYCLSITDRGNGLYAVQITETPPDGGAPQVWPQLVQTTKANGKYWIATSKPLEDK